MINVSIVGIDNQKGFDVGMNAGIIVAIFFGSFFFMISVVNLLRWRFVRRNTAALAQ